MTSRSRAPFVSSALFVLCVGFAGACNATGAGSFLVFGGAHSPQASLVESVRGAQEEASAAREDYGAAFHLYQKLTAPQAVELDELSDDFTDSIEACEESAGEVAERIDAIRRESEALFRGWNEELARFSGELLRKKSEAMMLDTQARAQRVLDALERAHARTQPVLQKLQDYALFFHHNLNARAIATLQDTYRDFDAEFQLLAAELDQSQVEIQAFLSTFVEPVASEAAPAK